MIMFPKGTTSDDVTNNAKVAQLVEHDLAKVGVASSNLVFRSGYIPTRMYLITDLSNGFP